MATERGPGDLGGIGAQGGRGDPVRLRAGSRGSEGAAPALPEAGRQSPGLRAATGPQQQRFGDLGSAEPLVRHRERPLREQAVPHPQRSVGLAGEPVAVPAFGEQHDRADDGDGEQRRSGQADPDPERCHGDAARRVVDDTDVARVHTGLDQQVEHRPAESADAGERRERQRGEPQPGPVEPGDLHGRLFRRRGGDGGAVEQHPPQTFGLRRGDGVEIHAGRAVETRRRSRRRPDLHDAQAEDPVQQRGIEVDGADPVARHRAPLPAQPAGVQLDPLVGDPVAGGPPAEHPGEHDDGGAADREPDLGEVAGAAGEQHDEQEGKQLHQVLDRPDHEHARIEAPPCLVDRGVSVTWRRPTSRGWSR